MREKLESFFHGAQKAVRRTIRQRKFSQDNAEHFQKIRRVIGRDIADGSPVFEPPGNKSWVIYGGAGSGKTTCVSNPAVQSLIWDHTRALVINDVKSGEITHQIAALCIKLGRKFAVIDDSYVMGIGYPYRIRVNPFGNLVTAFQKHSPDLLLEIETAANTIIPEPEGGLDKNFFFRQVPREVLVFAILALLEHSATLTTPGGLTAFISDPETFNSIIDIEAEEGEELTRNRARQLKELRDKDPEHYSQHTLAAQSALRLFMAGSPLAEAGRDADVTHEQLLKEKYIVCVVQNPRNAARLGTYYGLLFNAFLSAQLSAECGKTTIIFDEVANTPAKEIIEKVTVFRGAKLQVLYIAQSRADLIRQNGEKLIQTLEDNCCIQWLQFGNFEEAERVSKAIGEIDNVNFNLGGSSDKPDFTTTFQTGREPLFTIDELMSLPPSEQFLRVPGVGWIHCLKIRQNEIAPSCFDLGENPVEGGWLELDVKINLADYFEVMT